MPTDTSDGCAKYSVHSLPRERLQAAQKWEVVDSATQIRVVSARYKLHSALRIPDMRQELSIFRGKSRLV